MPSAHSKPPQLSQRLKDWLKSDNDKTLVGFNNVFGEKAFAISFVVLMALPALPLPTGGVTHVTELITALLALEMLIGRQTIWLPKRWLKLNASKIVTDKLVGVIAWFERLSRQRLAWLLVARPAVSLLALIILIFTVAAFVAPPFSGLDTLPALGVVIISLGIILEDILIVLFGVVAGIAGIGLEIAAGTALYAGLKHFF